MRKRDGIRSNCCIFDAGSSGMMSSSLGVGIVAMVKAAAK
jgi:hypothetical protein